MTKTSTLDRFKLYYEDLPDPNEPVRSTAVIPHFRKVKKPLGKRINAKWQRCVNELKSRDLI